MIVQYEYESPTNLKDALALKTEPRASASGWTFSATHSPSVSAGAGPGGKA